MARLFNAPRSACAIAFASRKSRMRAPLHRRTEEIGACLADPFANGEGGKIDTFTFPGRAQAAGVSTQRQIWLGPGTLSTQVSRDLKSATHQNSRGNVGSPKGRCQSRVRRSANRRCLSWVMYGRRPPCKRNLTISEGFGCGHVFGL